MLKGKKILIGITGGIAAYKIPILIRLLIREGAQVQIIMSHEASNFVTPLTLSVLSQNPVAVEPFNESTGQWHSHIELGSWADAFLIAPLTANTMAKMASGITDSLLLATYLAARCPVFFAPSMDVDMYNHPTTQKNIETLQSFGNILIAPQPGELASGLNGMGRLEEPVIMFEILKSYFSRNKNLFGKKVLVTSGPTIEAIDPVRFISNHSTGKMGNAIALAAARMGAQVILISGPVSNYPIHPDIEIIKIKTAAEMYDKCIKHFQDAQITIMAAAVADYTPQQIEKEKIKKKEESLNLQFVKTRDILAALGKMKRSDQILVGFALETSNELENANNKLYTKNLDFIVLNSLKDDGAGFGHDTNKVVVISKDKIINELSLKPKSELAIEILDLIQ
jgi:phosphopantothenoylcysteine decarboxylase/phosphopantothenate--cysteine ligase